MGRNLLVISYLTLRKVVGVLGTSFPFVLMLGAMFIFESSIQSSISSYYYTGMGDVFVGTLCVIGFFLFSYRGYDRIDNIAGNFACLFAVGVALFPAEPEPPATQLQEVIGNIHLVFAGLFFSTLIYFSLFLFTKTDKSKPTQRKRQRNLVYRVCGYIMIGCILGIVLYYIVPDHVSKSFDRLDPVFWLEGIAVVSFGISWLTKGEAILADKPSEAIGVSE